MTKDAERMFKASGVEMRTLAEIKALVRGSS
jgi:hypothetical protein